MKNFVIILIITLIFCSCKQKITENDVAKINGYWEIEKVDLPNGGKKQYKINEAIDYFEIKNNKGFRKKVYPQLDGKYLVNDLIEKIVITHEKEEYFINYSTEYAKWKEQILEIKDSTFVLKNKDDLEYHYKKQIPFSLK
ncbi:MAG: hypothetical protein H7239_09130 [Flavobacterium sp.]|nr:hypothetical protein [Flavobacterium sp.]